MSSHHLTFIEAQIDPTIRRQAEGILETLGLSPSAAITQFYIQIILHRGLPFMISLPAKDAVCPVLPASTDECSIHF